MVIGLIWIGSCREANRFDGVFMGRVGDLDGMFLGVGG